MGAGGDTRMCVFVGDESLTVQCAEQAASRGLDVHAVVSRNPLVLRQARSLGFATVDSTSGLGAALGELDVDVLFSIANLRVVPRSVLARTQLAVNFHDGPLPEYAGLNVTSWAILNGEERHGITWHLMTDEVDGGAIVTTETFPIGSDETAFSLNAACFQAGLESFPRVADMVATRTLHTTPQSSPHHRLYLRRDRPSRLLDLSRPADELERLVRALCVGRRTANHIGVPLILHAGQAVVVERAELTSERSDRPAGTVVAVDGTTVRVCTGTDDLMLTLAPVDARQTIEWRDGDHVASPSAELVAEFAAHDRRSAAHDDAWTHRLGSARSLLPGAAGGGSGWGELEVVGSGLDAPTCVAGVAAWLARLNGTDLASFGCDSDAAAAERVRLAGLLATPVSVLDVASASTFEELRAAATRELELLDRLGPPLSDLWVREPALDRTLDDRTVALRFGAGPTDLDTAAEDVVLHADVSLGQLTLHHRRAAVDDAQAGRFAEQLAHLLQAGSSAPDTPLRSLPVVGPNERTELSGLNATDVEHDRTRTVDDEFRAQVGRTPTAPAVSAAGTTLSYAELDRRVTAMAGAFTARGAGRGSRIGIAVPRGIDMVTAVLATLRVGAAYVPLDPTYPLERLTFMIDDSGLSLLVATGEVAARLARPGLEVLDPSVPVPDAVDDFDAPEASDLAYVIYTSGSTGRPKGVMLEHGNVVNFFVAMDRVIDHDTPRVWLAVTSLSFDISVLELLWTLTRGFHVVVKRSSGLTAAAAPTRPVSLSLFYFAAGAGGPDAYRLLLEGARFADRHGFEAVWTPERHFHAFGGAYPNPSVTSAALAVATERVAIRAGSVVLPLHAETRVAEEWAVVDNLSGGRIGISFAAGWQPNDFVLNPAGYERANQDLPSRIETVRALWRGDAVSMPGPQGAEVDVRTLPRPVQAELPVWLTSAGSPSTFERAGALGFNVLTHLLGQSVDELAANVRRYREARAAAGHDGEGHVTLMLHTYLADDARAAKATAKDPMKGYLGASASLIKNMASAFPTFAGAGAGADDAFNALTADQMDQLLDVAADRYLEESGLFGTAEDAAATIERLAAVGVDEVACLIDFGVATPDALSSLDHLARAKALIDARRDGDAGHDDESVASLVGQYGVSHLQCTPSLAAMLMADPADRAALATIAHLMVGGEALPVTLATELRATLTGRLTNMYGPTETTIWSLVHEVADRPAGPVPIGRPIANNTVHVLDAHGMPVPIGVYGELHIGGQGVARGYHERPELTAERFVERLGHGVLYATGDIVRVGHLGVVEFAGRADNQTKIRGHRIELGEIESVLDGHPTVAQSVVVIRGDEVDPMLVAFVVPAAGADVDADVLRKHVADALPPAMVPAVVARLDEMPLTPNGKVDRKALPDAVSVDVSVAPDALPTGDLESLVASVWERALGRRVGRDDNFFEIGGHSLLAVRLFRELVDVAQLPIVLTDIFRYPTVRSFATALTAAADGNGAASDRTTTSVPDGSQRGARRRQALARRGGSDSG